MLRRLAAGLCAAMAIAGCASTPQAGLQPFTTDGCSMFPDRSLTGSADWCHCCVAHDLAYWRGGTAEQRLQADEQLKACVQQSTGDAALAQMMFNGVRVGGSPELRTSFRWGYGWPYGRSYAPLTAQESDAADAFERSYRAGNPALACPQAPAAASNVR